MKKLSVWMAVAVLSSAFMCSCGGDDGEGVKPVPAPQIKMVGADIDAVHEIEEGMSVKVAVTAPAGIETFGIKITSPALSDMLLGAVGLASEMDLVNPATEAMAGALKDFGFPVGEDVAGKETLSFDISTLVPLIKLLPATASADHVFELTVGDAKNQTTVKSLKFHTTYNDVTYNEDADLWVNTATLKVTLGAEAKSPELEYKRSNDTEWQKATLTLNADKTYTAKIEPAWSVGADHASGTKQYSLDGKTGVFAGSTYDYRLLNDGEEVDGTAGTFTTTAGAVVPGGDMNAWDSQKVTDLMGDEHDMYFLTTPIGDEKFWGSGNNNMTPGLCKPETVADQNLAAKMQGNLAFGVIYAAGNLFTGVFEMASVSGTAKFGQKYTFETRPRALKVRYKATINNISVLCPDGGVMTPPAGAVIGEIDPARIFVSIVDWTDRHGVQSGMGVTNEQVNAYDPEVALNVTEGKTLAYASKTITASATDWVELELPLLYNDKTAKPGAENYSLVISCASSMYGDFLCGNPDNVLIVDDFEWIY